jgi:mRNA interferase MazF
VTFTTSLSFRSPSLISRDQKTRPALALSPASSNASHGQTVFAMITTASGSHWPSDVVIRNLAACGLSRRSVVRFKLFTLDNRLIARKIGSLAPADRQEIRRVARSLLQL